MPRFILILMLTWTSLLLPGAVQLWAMTADAGTNNPFEYGAGSRALALGGAYVAVADDVSALFWNPAGLAQLEQIELSAMHIDLFFNTPYDFVGIAYPLLDWGTLALGAAHIATQDITVRDERSRPLSQGSIEMWEYLLGLSREIAFNLQAGLTLKVDQQHLLGNFSSGVGLDLGLHYRLSDLAQWSGFQGLDWEHLTLGVMLQNVIGSRMQMDEVVDVLPLNLKVGLAYQYLSQDTWKQRLLFSASWERSTWRTSLLALGLEYQVLEIVAVRGGLSSMGWMLGGGLHYAGAYFDYALASETLGLTHRFTLSYRFGTPLSEQRQKREMIRQKELDQEAARRARVAMEKTSQAMEKVMQESERQHRREKQALLAQQQQKLEEERRRQSQQQKVAVADEYFKALHYFQGIKDFLAKNYQDALVEFETVEKYDPNYLELALYLARTRQQLQGGITTMSEEMLNNYYRGIDCYVENQFDQAVAYWEKILEQQPNNALALRNIEEAKERAAKLQAVQKQLEQEEIPAATPTPVSP